MRNTKKRKAAKRATAPLTITLPANLKPPADTTCGCYIRSLLVAGKGTEEILALVHKHYRGSTAKGSDISWNRAKLRAAGKKLPGARKAAKAKRRPKTKAKRKARRKAEALQGEPEAEAAAAT